MCVCICIYNMHLVCTTFVTIFYKVTGYKCNLEDGYTKRPVNTYSCILLTKLSVLEYNHMGNVAGLRLGSIQFTSLKWNSYCALVTMAFFIHFQHISGTVTLNNVMPLLLIRSFLLVRIKWNT